MSRQAEPLPYRTTRDIVPSGRASWPAEEYPLHKGTVVHIDRSEANAVIIEDPDGTLRAVDVDEVWLNQALLAGDFEPVPAHPKIPQAVGEPHHATRLIDHTTVTGWATHPPIPAHTNMFVDTRNQGFGGKPATIRLTNGISFNIEQDTFNRLVSQGLLVPGHTKPIRGPGTTGNAALSFAGSGVTVVGTVTKPQNQPNRPRPTTDNRQLFRHILKKAFPHANDSFVSFDDVGMGTAAVSTGPFRITISQGDNQLPPTRVVLHWGADAKIIDIRERKEPFNNEAELTTWTSGALDEIKATIRFMQTSIEHLTAEHPPTPPLVPITPVDPALIPKAQKVVEQLDRRPDLRQAVHTLLDIEAAGGSIDDIPHTPIPPTTGPWVINHTEGRQLGRRLMVGIDPASGTDGSGLVIAEVTEANKPGGRKQVRVVYSALINGPGETASIGETTHKTNLDTAFNNACIKVDNLLALNGWTMPDSKSPLES